MSVHNGATYLKEAIDSVLNQTFSNFEYIIINDASSDRTHDIIKTYTDERINYIINPENLGLTKSLNKAISMAQGKYIARMDADDICQPDRLSEQVLYMESNSDIGICGTNFEVIGKKKRSHFPLDHETINIKLFQGINPLAHPSVIIRKELFIDKKIFYDENIKYAQDYKLWVDAVKHIKLANISDILLKYRIHNNQISASKNKEQKQVVEFICIEQVKELMPSISDNEINTHLNFIHEKKIIDIACIDSIQNWAYKLIRRNRQVNKYDLAIFEKEIIFILKRIKMEFFTHKYLRATSYYPSMLRLYLSPRYNMYKYYSLKVGLIFVVKCVIRYKK